MLRKIFLGFALTATILISCGSIDAIMAATPKMHVDVGLNHFYKNRYLEAYREFKAALDIDQNYPEAHYNLGRVYKIQGFIKEALVEFQIAVQLKPDYLAAKRELEALKKTLEADIDAQLRLQGKDTVSQTAFDKLPSGELESKAREALNQGKISEAIKLYKQLSEDNPRDSSVHKMLGFLYFRENKYSDAIENYNKALNLTPTDSEISYSLGLIYLKTGPVNRAENYFNQAIKLYPEMLKAYFALGEVYESQGRIDDAVFQFKKCLELNPNLQEAKSKLSYLAGKQGYSYFSRGSYYYQRGDYENALSMLSMAVSYGSLTPDQIRQADEMVNTSRFWLDKKRAEQKAAAEREQVRSEAVISRSFLVTDVSRNVFPYVGKAVEWEGQIESITTRRGKTVLLINTDPSVSADSNMDYCFEAEIDKALPKDARIASLASASVLGKVLRVDKLRNSKSGSFSSRRQPVIEVSEITFNRRGYVQPLVLRF